MAWRKIELAKHRLFYTLMKLKLPLDERKDDGSEGWHSIFWQAWSGRRPAGHDRSRQWPDHDRA